MPRGRPRKVIEEKSSIDDKEKIDAIATIVHKYCNIPGCSSRWHQQEAKEILKALEGVE